MALLIAREIFEGYLRGGQFAPGADDNVTGEVVEASVVQHIVVEYNKNPSDAGTVQALGLLALLVGVAE